MIALLMWGGWSPAEEHSIVVIFGWSLGGFIAAMTAVIVGLLAGGPVGRFKVAATRTGATIEAVERGRPRGDQRMTYFRLLNIQGIAGLAVSVCLALLLVIQKGDTRHWRKQSDQFEQLYRGEQAAFASTVANYRAAAEAARAADKAAAERVRAEQAAINQRSNHDLQTRLADARARADRLRQLAQSSSRSRQSRRRACARPIRCRRRS